MGKRMLSLYVEDEAVELAKIKRINMSKLFSEMLNIETSITKGNELQEMKILNSKLKTELEETRIKLEKVINELNELKEKGEKEKWKNRIVLSRG